MLQLTVNEDRSLAVSRSGDQWSLDASPVAWESLTMQNGIISVLYKGKSYTAVLNGIDRAAKEVSLTIAGQNYKVRISEPIDQMLSNLGMNVKAGKKVEPIKAPMPGMVLRVLVQPGQQIAKGDGLIVLEAMKMENVLKASFPAVVKSVKAIEKTPVEKGDILIELE